METRCCPYYMVLLVLVVALSTAMNPIGPLRMLNSYGKTITQSA